MAVSKKTDPEALKRLREKVKNNQREQSRPNFSTSTSRTTTSSAPAPSSKTDPEALKRLREKVAKNKIENKNENRRNRILTTMFKSPTTTTYSDTVKYLNDKGVVGASDIMTENEWESRKGNENGTYQNYLASQYNKYGAGNIDLTLRPRYKNSDNTISTVDSFSINENGKEILLPTVVWGENGTAKMLSEKEAIEHYHKTGEHLGKFDTIEDANAYADILHEMQAMYYSDGESDPRSANFWDVTVNSFKRGWNESRYGQESWKEANGWDNKKDYYEEKLKEYDNAFKPDNWFEEMVSGGMGLLGQQVKQWTDPKALGGAATGATMAFIAGQAGPQIVAPEELLTVPVAAIAGFEGGNAVSNYEIEAGHAYNEMIEYGISHDVAKNVANVVGAGNAALEMVQLDDLIKSAKILKTTNADNIVTNKILAYLKERGVHIATETGQEVMQEGVTLAGIDAARMVEGKDAVYSWNEVVQRLGDTAKSSALSFAFLGGAGDVTNIGAKGVRGVTSKIGKRPQLDNPINPTQPDTTQSPTPTTLEEAAKGAIENKNKKKKSGKITAETLDALTADNETISVDEVKAVTGFGDKGAGVVTELANRNGVTFSQALNTVDTAYRAGLSGAKKSVVTFDNKVQETAFEAGMTDRVMQDTEKQAKAKDATLYDGAFHENEYTKNFTKAEKKMISTVAKLLRMDVDTVDKILAGETYVNGKKVKHYANASHTDGKMVISDDRQASAFVYKMVLHEGGHRMGQFATKEWGALMNALYQRAEQFGRIKATGVTPISEFAKVKDEHDKAGITKNTIDYVEEVAVRELETIFSSAEEFNKWYAEISQNQELKNNWQKFCDWITQIINEIKNNWSQRKMTAEQKAAANELEHIKELLAEAYKASDDFAQQREAELSNKTSVDNNVDNTTTTEAKNKSTTKETVSGDETTKPQTKMPGVKVGDVYKADGKTYTIASRNNGRTTYEVTDENGNTSTKETSNVTADINFTKEDVFTKVDATDNKATKASVNNTIEDFINQFNKAINDGSIDSLGLKKVDLSTTGGMIEITEKQSGKFYVRDIGNDTFELYPDKDVSNRAYEPLFKPWCNIQRNGGDVINVTKPLLIKDNKFSGRYDLLSKGEVAVNTVVAKSGASFSLKETTDAKYDDENKQYTKNKFYSQLDNWDGKTVGFSFVLGTTSKALIDAGVPNKQIRWDATKIKKLLSDHKGMSIDVVREIPNLLENPVVVIDSKKNADSRIVMGDLHDENGKLVTVVLLLTPTSKKGNQLDIIKVSSAQGRSHIESLFRYEDGRPVRVRFVDEKRIQSWLNVNRLQLPLHSFNLDSNDNVPQNPDSVKSDFPLKDSNGNTLTQEQQEYFKDSKVRDENGNLLVMYQGANEDFTVFDRKKSKYSNLYGRGFYFTKSERHAKQYGNTRAYYLDIKHPVSTTETTITKSQLRKFLEAVTENEDYSFENYGYDATIDSVLQSTYGKSDFLMLNDISQTAIGDLVEAVELFNEVNGTDYDGIMLDTETVTFNSEQAKLTSNEKPTSNPDVRFSLKNPDLTDNDLTEYLKTGKKLHTRNKKQRMLESGKKPILTSSVEVKKFILDVIHGRARGEVRAFKKIGKKLADAIYNKRNSLHMLGKYLELNADDLREAYKMHSSPKEKGDIPLSEKDFESIPEYLDEFDGVLSVNTYNNKVEIHIYKETEEGYMKILTVASNERNSLQVTKLIGVSKEKFHQKYAKKIEGDIGSLWSLKEDSNPSTTAQHTADVPSTKSISLSEEKVKSSSEFSLKNTNLSTKDTKELLDVIEHLKGEFEITKFAKADPKKLAKMTKALLKEYSSQADYDETFKAIDELYKYMANGEDVHPAVWGDVYERAYDIAEKIVENAIVVDDYQYKEYKSLRDYLRNTPMKFDTTYDEVPTNYENFQDFRRRNYGRLNFTKDGMSIDSVYQELAEMYPEFFDAKEQTNTADQLEKIIEVLDSLKPLEVNPFSREVKETSTMLANDILDRFFDIPQAKPTFADKAERRVVEAHIKGGKKVEAVRQQKDEKIQKLIERQREKTKKQLDKVREQRDAKVKREQQKRKDAISRMSESQKAKVLRAQIMRHTSDLSKKLLRPTDNQHIPEDLRGVVATLLESINLESNYTYNPDSHSYKKSDEGLPTKRTQAFEALRKLYGEIASSVVVDPDLLGENGLLSDVILLADKRIADMNSGELQTVWDAVRAIEASVNTANKMFSAGKFETILEFAEALREDNAKKKEKTEFRGALGKGKKLATLDMLTPETYFHYLGGAGNSIFRMMRDAQDKHISIMKEVADFTRKTLKGVNVNSLEKKIHTVKLGGEDVQLTTAQLMELYVLMRREQAIEHILVGGILPDVTEGKGGKLNTKAEPIRNISLDEITEALSALTSEQKKVADELQKFVSTVLAEYGNEASMKVYNYEKFNEKNYWTIRTNKQEIQSDVGKDTAVTSVANKGMAKGTKPHANTSVRIGSIFDTFATHSSDMATYAAWLGTTEDVNRIRNFVFWTDGKRIGTVKGILDTVHGMHGSEYLQKLLTDVSIGVKGTDNMNPFDKLVGGYKAASVGANIRVIIQQPTALLRAMDMIGAHYLATGAVRPLKGWKKALKYAPIAQWKDWGYFDINTGRQMKDILFDNASLLEKTKQASMWGASMADSLAWGQLWNAVEAETKAKHKDLKVGSEGYYETVAKRFTEIVDHTQVVDGIMQRSQIMRSSDALTKMATSFMGEPTKQYNMAVSAAYDAMNSKGDARKKAVAKLGRTAVSLAVAGIINACVQSIVDALRDDDKEKDYWQKWLIAFKGDGEDTKFVNSNLGDTINPLNYVPFAKDIVSIMQGYDVKRMDAESITKTFNAITNMYKAVTGTGKYTISEASAQLFAEVARLYGLPVANVKRDVKSLVMTYANETDNYLMQYRMEKAMLDINYSGNNKNFMDILFNAYNSDKKAYEFIYNDLLKSGYEVDKIQSGMETRMKKAEGVEKASELSKRYMIPATERKYNSSLRQIASSEAWKSANAKQRNNAKNELYSYLTSTSEDVKKARAEAKEYGVDETEYVLWQLAKEMVNDNKDSMNAKEKAEAIKMLDLGNSELAFFYNTETSDKAFANGVDIEGFANFKAEVSGLTGKNKQDTVEYYAEKYARNTKEYLFFMGSEYSSYKKRSDYISYFGREK